MRASDRCLQIHSANYVSYQMSRNLFAPIILRRKSQDRLHNARGRRGWHATLGLLAKAIR